MDNELIKRLAWQAGFMDELRLARFALPSLHSDGLHRFAALVAEECAKTADGLMAVDPKDPFKNSHPPMASDAAEAIRAKFKAKT